jgi:hypothetical protein
MLAVIAFFSLPQIDRDAMTGTVAEIFRLKRWLSFANRGFSRRHTLSQNNAISRRELLCKVTAVAVDASAALPPISVFAVPATSKQNSNASDVHLDGTGNETSFIKKLLPAVVEKKMGIIGMKVPSLANIFRPNGIATTDQARSHVPTLPASTVIISIKIAAEPEENVHIAHSFKPSRPKRY